MRISDWSSDVCSSDLAPSLTAAPFSRNGNATGNFARYCTIWSGTLTNLIEGTDDRRQIHSRRPRPQDHGASAQRRSRVARENRRRPRRGARYVQTRLDRLLATGTLLGFTARVREDYDALGLRDRKRTRPNSSH